MNGYVDGWIDVWKGRWCLWFSHSVVSDSFDPVDCSPPDFSVHGILQARTLEQVAIFFFKRSSPLRIKPMSCYKQIACLSRFPL
mgnify:CR=1 FL=1